MALGSKWFRPRGHSSYIDLYRKKTFKIFLCETRRHRPLIVGMSLYQGHTLCEVSILPN